MKKIKKILFGTIFTVFALVLVVVPAFADTVNVNFESPTYTVANINGQDGWSKTGAFDVAVVSNTYGFGTFGLQSLRTSDAVTSGSFGDQTFAKPLIDAVGEADSTDGTFSRGTLQRHFEMQFDIASTLPTLQAGMHVSVSPDRGDGSRMSYLRFEDHSSSEVYTALTADATHPVGSNYTDGIHVYFDDVQGVNVGFQVANFVETDIATISRVPHTIKLTMDLLDGPSNDVVKVYVDGVLKITGTSWENYYRFDTEAAAEPSPRIVRTVLFRESGGANPLNSGKGFLVDNLSLLSGPILVGPPTNKDQCKKDGWKIFNNPSFRNQGQCVSYVEKHSNDEDHDNNDNHENNNNHGENRGHGEPND